MAGGDGRTEFHQHKLVIRDNLRDCLVRPDDDAFLRLIVVRAGNSHKGEQRNGNRAHGGVYIGWGRGCAAWRSQLVSYN